MKPAERLAIIEAARDLLRNAAEVTGLLMLGVLLGYAVHWYATPECPDRPEGWSNHHAEYIGTDEE